MVSDYRESCNTRRDARHTKDPKEVGAHKSSKDTKKWCKGKVGVKHVGVCENPSPNLTPGSLFYGIRNLICKNCGKRLDAYWPGLTNPKKAPDWVDK